MMRVLPSNLMEMKLFGMLRGLLVLLVCSSFLFISCSKSHPNFATDFKLTVLNSDTTFIQLSDINKELPVLLLFWASWCEDCAEKFSEITEWHRRENLSNKLRLLGVNMGESKKDVSAYLKQHKIDVPIALDLDEQVATSYGVTKMPTVVLLAKEGEIRYYGFTLPGQIEKLIDL